MIKISKSDSLIDIVNMINNSKEDIITLDFPFGHQVLHSYLSLKIIKNKCNEKGLVIITNDLSAKKIGKRIGIKYSISGNIELVDNHNILKYNFTIPSYISFQIKKYYLEVKNIFKNKNNNKQLDINNINTNTRSRIGFFIIILTVSLSIFIFIFYFAVNKTIITIIPEVTIKLKSRNIIFTEKEDINSSNDNLVLIKKITSTAKISEIFGTSGIEREDNKKSSGKIILYNLLTEEVNLIKNTRLETKEGIIYKINSDINIHKAEITRNGIVIPGQIEAFIEAKNLDRNGNNIGSNGNISKGIKLTLPGLKENKDKIYAITKSKIEGGNDNFNKFLTKIDIDNGYKLLEYKLKQLSVKEIKKIIQQKNTGDNSIYDIVGVDDIIKYSNLQIVEVGNYKIGDKIDTFSLSGTIDISTYIYNKNTIVNKMRSTIKNSIIEGNEKITYINTDSIRISNILYKEQFPKRIKATVEIEVSLSHNFNNKNNYYVEKLKNKILGINKDEALRILLNDNKISGVTINIRPFFIKKISSLLNNIEFKLND